MPPHRKTGLCGRSGCQVSLRGFSPPCWQGPTVFHEDPMTSVRDHIRTIPDFPAPGIMFRDVTTLFGDPRGFRLAVDQLLQPYAGTRIDKVAGLEARGFILGGAVAHQLSAGFVPIRKQGKLPGRTISQACTLEYGAAVMESHDDALLAGDRILLVDGLLPTLDGCFSRSSAMR